MPERSIQSDPELETLLEAVRVRRGLATAEEALAWLVKTRLSRTVGASTAARRRMLQLVRKGGQA